MKPIFRYILVITALICVQGAFAKNKAPKTILINSIYYQLNEEKKTATAVAAPPDKKGKITYPEHVIFPDTITYKKQKYVFRTIDTDAFFVNQDIKRITVPNTLTYVDCYTLSLCTKLEWPVYNDKEFIYLPSEYTKSHSDYAIPEGIETIKSWAISNLYDDFSLTMPNSVTTIEPFAINDCWYPLSVSISTNVTVISTGAFWRCALKSITIPNNIKIIESGAFADCQLEKITLGTGIEVIAANAFHDNYKRYEGGPPMEKLDKNGQRQYTIREIAIYRETPPEVEGHFEVVPNQKEIILYVPFYSVDKYTNHPEWGKFDVRPIPPVNDIMLTYMR